MASRKPREVANPSVSRDAISAQVATFKGNKSWNDLVFCNLVKEQHNVTPTTMATVAPLLQGFLEIGFENCVLPTPKIETAILRSIPSGEKPPRDYCQTRWITEVADHVRLVFNALRLHKLEDDNEQRTPSGRRRYPKTGGFRKKKNERH